MVLVVVYVGAVAVLFLFVVMMLDINFSAMREGFLNYLPIGALIGIILLVELVFIFGSWAISPGAAGVAFAPTPPIDSVTNTRALGRLIYTDYVYLFQASGLVLLVFVVMMLDINFSAMREGFLNYLPIGALIGIILWVELVFIFGSWAISPDAAGVAFAPTPPIDSVTNTRALGRLIYTDYVYLFQASGLVLLVAMIGAITLTLRKRPGVRRQRIAEQVARPRDAVIEVRKVPTGSGA